MQEILKTILPFLSSPSHLPSKVENGGHSFNNKGEVIGLTTASLWSLRVYFLRVSTKQLNHLLLKIIIGTVTEALQSNREIVVLPTYSSSRPDFIEVISTNVVLNFRKN